MYVNVTMNAQHFSYIVHMISGLPQSKVLDLLHFVNLTYNPGGAATLSKKCQELLHRRR